VSVPWAWKVSAAQKRSGTMERAAQSRHGRPSRVDRAEVTRLLKAKPDMVLRELREELERTTGVAVSHTQMWRVVRELGLRLKKVAPRHRARHRGEPHAARSLPEPAALHRPGAVDLPR
jgi:transposase